MILTSVIAAFCALNLPPVALPLVPILGRFTTSGGIAFGVSSILSRLVDVCTFSPRSLPWLRGAAGELGLSVAQASSDVKEGVVSRCFSLDVDDRCDCDCSRLCDDVSEGTGGGEYIGEGSEEDGELLFLFSFAGFTFPGVPSGFGGAPRGFDTAASGGGGGGAWRFVELEIYLCLSDEDEDVLADDDEGGALDDAEGYDDDEGTSNADERRRADIENERAPWLPTANVSAAAVEAEIDAADPAVPATPLSA